MTGHPTTGSHRVSPVIDTAELSAGFRVHHPAHVDQFAPPGRRHLHVCNDDAFELRVGRDRLGVSADRGYMNPTGVPRFQSRSLSRTHALVPRLPCLPVLVAMATVAGSCRVDYRHPARPGRIHYRPPQSSIPGGFS